MFVTHHHYLLFFFSNKYPLTVFHRNKKAHLISFTYSKKRGHCLFCLMSIKMRLFVEYTKNNTENRTARSLQHYIAQDIKGKLTNPCRLKIWQLNVCIFVFHKDCRYYNVLRVYGWTADKRICACFYQFLWVFWFVCLTDWQPVYGVPSLA